MNWKQRGGPLLAIAIILVDALAPLGAGALTPPAEIVVEPRAIGPQLPGRDDFVRVRVFREFERVSVTRALISGNAQVTKSAVETTMSTKSGQMVNFQVEIQATLAPGPYVEVVRVQAFQRGRSRPITQISRRYLIVNADGLVEALSSSQYDKIVHPTTPCRRPDGSMGTCITGGSISRPTPSQLSALSRAKVVGPITRGVVDPNEEDEDE